MNFVLNVPVIHAPLLAICAARRVSVAPLVQVYGECNFVGLLPIQHAVSSFLQFFLALKSDPFLDCRGVFGCFLLSVYLMDLSVTVCESVIR